jgi:uncharacterized membrane protein YphA (DoxX/SURF4 family)
MGSNFKDYAPFAIRLGIALLFILEGARGIAHAPARVEPIVIASIEILGGLFALIGFLSRWAGAALMVLMVWTILDGPRLHVFTEKHEQWPLAALFMSFALFALGGGKWSVDASSKKKDGH